MLTKTLWSAPSGSMAGLDVAYGYDGCAVYVTMGSAWPSF